MTHKPPEPIRQPGMDDPLPDDADILVEQITALAAYRREEARSHRRGCKCSACVIRRRHAILAEIRRAA